MTIIIIIIRLLFVSSLLFIMYKLILKYYYNYLQVFVVNMNFIYNNIAKPGKKIFPFSIMIRQYAAM